MVKRGVFRRLTGGDTRRSQDCFEASYLKCIPRRSTDFARNSSAVLSLSLATKGDARYGRAIDLDGAPPRYGAARYMRFYEYMRDIIVFRRLSPYAYIVMV